MASPNKLDPIPHPPKKPVVGNMLSLDPNAPVQKIFMVPHSHRRHCERSEAIHLAALRMNGLLRRFAPLRKRFAFVAGNDDAAPFLNQIFFYAIRSAWR